MPGAWIEFANPVAACDRLILPVAPRGHPEVLAITEADASLVAEHLWKT